MPAWQSPPTFLALLHDGEEIIDGGRFPLIPSHHCAELAVETLFPALGEEELTEEQVILREDAASALNLARCRPRRTRQQITLALPDSKTDRLLHIGLGQFIVLWGDHEFGGSELCSVWPCTQRAC